MSEATHLVTAEDMERWPEDDYRYELVDGRVIKMSPVGPAHGIAVARLLFLIGRHLEGRRLGVAMTEVGFKLKSDPDTVRAPDVAFIRQERIRPPHRGFWKEGPPDLAMEVLSPDETPREVRDKIDDYLSHGVPLVVIVDTDDSAVTLHRTARPPVTLRSDDDVLDLGDVIAGFHCRLREIFTTT